MGIGGALWVIYLARAIEGLGGGGLGVTQAYVGDVSTPEERARAFGLVGATFGVGFLIGPAISGVLMRFGYQVPLFLGALHRDSFAKNAAAFFKILGLHAELRFHDEGDGFRPQARLPALRRLPRTRTAVLSSPRLQ